MKKISIAFASLLILLVAALPAAAQGGVSASISGVGNGQAIQGTVTITGSASASTGVESISISVGGTVLKQQSWGGVQQNQSISVSWNTNQYNNGDYTVKVSATSNGGGSDSATARVLVDNAPSTPSGVNATHNEGTVTVSWNRNPESDVYAYRVSRNGSFLTETGGTSITDQPGPGTYNYSVTAVRYSPTNGSGKTGGSSSTNINVPTPPPPSSGGGTSGGGTVPGYGNGGSSSGGNSGNFGNPNAGGFGNTGSGSGGGRGGYGYNGGKGDKNGNAPGGVAGYGGSFAGGRSLAGIGLPNNLTLPGSRLKGYAPPAPLQADDGTYEENLPYDLSQGGNAELLGEEGLGSNIAARRTSFLIPPDGLRWIAAGLWFIVTAALLKFLERLVAKREEEEALAAVATTAESDGEQEDEAKAFTPKLKLVRRKDNAA